MNITPELQNRTDIIQADLHAITEIAFKSHKPVSYQYCMNTAMMMKLAELELKIEQIDQEIYNLKS